MGVSSISDSWNGFAQNVKRVEEYQQMLDQGQLPVVKGHLLDAEDVIIRRHILDLMCKGETKLTNGFLGNETILKKLQEMIDEGVVRIEVDQIIITSLGKSFLRNVCMAFDLRLQKSKSEMQLFSQAI
ncbi:Oxygen-independent coproporphyrinogen-III oxidase [compost metagenome]